MRRLTPLLLAAASVSALAACGATDAATPPSPNGTLGGVGSLPEPLSGEVVSRIPTGTIVPRPTIERPEEPLPVADRAAGTRVLVIGDSILASVSRRYSNELCDALVPLGWTVEVNAEVSRFIEFGERVLDRRLRPETGIDWDVAVISLGSNFNGDVEAYRAQLHRLLDRLEPRPTVLLTVTEIEADRVAVNDVIRGMLDYYADVQVVDWAELTAAESSLLSGDGLHLSPSGRERIAAEIADLIGPASASDDDAECLSTSFTDDSAGTRSSPVASSRQPTVTRPAATTTSSRPGTTEAAAPAPTTAPASGSGGGSGGGGSSGGGSSGGGSGGGGSSGGGSSGGGSGGGTPPATTAAPTTTPATGPTSPPAPTAPATTAAPAPPPPPPVPPPVPPVTGEATGDET